MHTSEISITISATVYFMFDQKQSNKYGRLAERIHKFSQKLYSRLVHQA